MLTTPDQDHLGVITESARLQVHEARRGVIPTCIQGPELLAEEALASRRDKGGLVE